MNGLVVSSHDIGVYKRIVVADPCCYCGEPAYCLDHIVPRVDGGPNTWDNLTAACERCNNAKSGRSLLSFLGARWHRPRWERAQRERGLWSQVGR